MRARTPAVVAIAVALLAGCTSSAPPRAPTRTAQVVPPTGVAKSPADWSKLRTFEVLTQYSPSSTFQSQATDLNRIAQSFTGILLASGSLGPSREQAVQLSSTLGLHVWLDLDLTADYAKGVSLTSTLEPLAAFAQQHRDVVVGVKLANELGQVDPYAHDPKLLEGYLRAVSSVLRAKAPGLPLTVDMPIPEAVCAQGSPGLAALGGETACRQTVLDRFPALAQVNVDHYLSLGLLDGVFVTPYLRQDEIYQAAGTDTADVLKFSYRWLKQRPWASQVRLFSRKALAFPDDRYRGTTGEAKLAIERHLQVPFAENLSGTDIWAWHRPFRGQLRTLIDKDGRTNALWDGLAGFRRQLPVNKPGTTGGRTPQPPAASAARA